MERFANALLARFTVASPPTALRHPETFTTPEMLDSIPTSNNSPRSNEALRQRVPSVENYPLMAQKTVQMTAKQHGQISSDAGTKSVGQKTTQKSVVKEQRLTANNRMQMMSFVNKKGFLSRIAPPAKLFESSKLSLKSTGRSRKDQNPSECLKSSAEQNSPHVRAGVVVARDQTHREGSVISLARPGAVNASLKRSPRKAEVSARVPSSAKREAERDSGAISQSEISENATQIMPSLANFTKTNGKDLFSPVAKSREAKEVYSLKKE